MMAQDDAPRPQQVRLAGHEPGKRSLDRFAVDVAAPGRGEDRDVGPEVAQDAGPVSRRVLVEERAGGCLEHVDERATVAAGALVAGAEVCLHVGVEAPEPLGQRSEARLLLLVGEAEIADADFVGVGHLRLRPHARVLARERGHRDIRRELDAFTARDGEQLLAGDALLPHDAHGLVRTEDLRAGVPGDRLRSPEVVEVRMADDNPVVLAAFEMKLKLSGFTVVTTPAAGEVARTVEKNGSELIILDINMAKGISGLGLLNMLRDNPRLNRVPVVVVTANDLYRDYAIRAGAKAFLVKPVKIADMADLANQLGAGIFV